MITCKLCNTALDRRHLRKDGSLMCPVCGQIYWRQAVLKAMETEELPAEVKHAELPRHRGRHSVRLRTVPITAR